jgi:hypothetical protein
MHRIRQASKVLFALTLCFIATSTIAWGQAPPAARTTGFLSRVYKDDSGNH